MLNSIHRWLTLIVFIVGLLAIFGAIILHISSEFFGNIQGLTGVLTVVVLVMTGAILYLQLRHLEAQGEQQRIFAARDSLQKMNKLIFSDTDVSFPILYPTISKGEAEALVMSFAAFNAWEVVYHMQKESNVEEFRKLLSGLVKDSVIGETWINQPPMRAAYDKNFREGGWAGRDSSLVTHPSPLSPHPCPRG